MVLFDPHVLGHGPKPGTHPKFSLQGVYCLNPLFWARDARKVRGVGPAKDPGSQVGEAQGSPPAVKYGGYLNNSIGKWVLGIGGPLR